jgi:hypothetical protein
MSDHYVVRTYLEQDAIIHTSSDREVCQEYLEYTNTWHPIDKCAFGQLTSIRLSLVSVSDFVVSNEVISKKISDSGISSTANYWLDLKSKTTNLVGKFPFEKLDYSRNSPPCIKHQNS